MTTNNHYLKPEWPAPHSIRAYTSTRLSGSSTGPYAHLIQDLSLPNEPIWLKQVHGNVAVSLDVPYTSFAGNSPTADASYTHQTNRVCAVLTADCLPILLADREGRAVAAIHAGWRGLLKGVIDATVQNLRVPPENLLAWLGPAIGPEMFEVGEEVRTAYLERDPQYAVAFKPHRNRWLADLYHLARLDLNQLGVSALYGGNFCTYQDQRRFYSHRRDNGRTGRMATLIWIVKP